MIGKAEWFARRKYGGWGLTPKTWQGWLYILVIIAPLILFQSLPFWSNKTRLAASIIWIIFIAVDVIDIMIHMRKDERETIHEAIAERNASWAMVAVLAIGILYQIISSALQEKLYFDPFLAGALFAGVAVKAASNIYLDKKN